MEDEADEDYELDMMAEAYKKKGGSVIGEMNGNTEEKKPNKFSDDDDDTDDEETTNQNLKNEAHDADSDSDYDIEKHGTTQPVGGKEKGKPTDSAVPTEDGKYSFNCSGLRELMTNIYSGRQGRDLVWLAYVFCLHRSYF